MEKYFSIFLSRILEKNYLKNELFKMTVKILQF